jgi:hypothetical protein
MSKKLDFGIHKMNSDEINAEVQNTPGSARHPLQFWNNPYRFLGFRIDTSIYDDDVSMVQSQIDLIHKIFNESGKSIEDVPNPLMRTYLDTTVDYRERIVCFMKIMKLSNLKKPAMRAWVDNERAYLDGSTENQFKLMTIESAMNLVYGEENL